MRHSRTRRTESDSHPYCSAVSPAHRSGARSTVPGCIEHIRRRCEIRVFLVLKQFFSLVLSITTLFSIFLDDLFLSVDHVSRVVHRLITGSDRSCRSSKRSGWPVLSRKSGQPLVQAQPARGQDS